VGRNVKLPLAACLACAATLGLLAVLALGFDASRHLDWRLFLRLAEQRHSHDGTLADAIAHLADPLPLLGMLAVACGIALLRGRSSDALAALLVVAGANITAQTLKILLAHPRVKVAIGGDPFEPNTFPSGHTTAAASIVVAYAFAVPVAWRAGALAVGTAFALAVGYSVVVIGWHYPSDVLAGFLIAAGWGFAVLAAMWAIGPRSRQGAGVSPRAPLPSP
jgi:membrane-associated phospholipid phosphatase